MNSVKEELPTINSMCNVKPTNPRLKPRGPYRFVTYSDNSGYFWDNLKDEILQEFEVSHWEYV